MPLLSYPAVQELFISVEDLIKSSNEMALGVRLIADRYNMPFATTYMDLSVEAEAFGATCTYHKDSIPTITGQIVSSLEEAEEVGITVMTTEMTTYTACGELYIHGLPGTKKRAGAKEE